MNNSTAWCSGNLSWNEFNTIRNIVLLSNNTKPQAVQLETLQFISWSDISCSLFSHQPKNNIFIPFTNISSFPAHKCWLYGFCVPCSRSHKQRDKQKQPNEHVSRCEHSSSQTRLKSKRHRVFISAHQNPMSSCFLGLRHTAGCVSISTASTIRQQADDRTLETLLRQIGLLHTDDGLLPVSLFF